MEELKSIIQTFPVWFQYLVLLWLIYTAVLVFIFISGPKGKVLIIDDFRQLVENSEQNCSLTLELIARNTLPEVVQLNLLKLAFYGERRPEEGGLQSYTRVSATYVLTDCGNGICVESGQNREHRNEIEIIYPYSGQEYAEVLIPLSQTINKDETDRFIVCLETDELPRESHRNIEATIRYNQHKQTEARTTEVNPR